MDTIDRLEKTIREHVLAALPTEARAVAAAQDLRSVVQTYAAWRQRYPAAIPRTLHESDALKASPHRATYASGLAAVTADIRKGRPVTPYLSSSTQFAAGSESTPLARRRDRDLMFSSWGIHHLHLSERTGRQGRNERTEHVLFVAFRGSRAYLIDIYPHPRDSNWAEKAIVETVVRNWPDAGVVVGSDYAIGVSGGNRPDWELLETPERRRVDGGRS